MGATTQKMPGPAAPRLSLAELVQCVARLLSANIAQFPQDQTYIIAITGDGALGKTTLARAICTQFDAAQIISTDGYILSRAERRKAGNLSGDDLRSLDFVKLSQLIEKLRRRDGELELYTYDHAIGVSRASSIVPTQAVRLAIIEGAFAALPLIQDAAHLRVFMWANSFIRFWLRMNADVSERGYNLVQFCRNWPTYNRLYAMIVEPCRHTADMILGVTFDRTYRMIATEVPSDALQKVDRDFKEGANSQERRT